MQGKIWLKNFFKFKQRIFITIPPGKYSLKSWISDFSREEKDSEKWTEGTQVRNLRRGESWYKVPKAFFFPFPSFFSSFLPSPPPPPPSFFVVLGVRKNAAHKESS
jgi:hypothetical protein